MGKRDHSGSADYHYPWEEMETLSYHGNQSPGSFDNWMYTIICQTFRRVLFSMFKWTGLTRKQVRELETRLLYEDGVGIIKTEFSRSEQTPDGFFIGRPAPLDGSRDFYGHYTNLEVFGRNGHSKKTRNADMFIVGHDSLAIEYEKMSITPPGRFIQPLAKFVLNAFLAKEVSVETNKSGVIYQVSDGASARRVTNALKSVKDNNPYTVIEFPGDNSGANQILFRPSSSAIVSEYNVNYLNAWAIALEFFGVKSGQTNKRERTTVLETELNNSLAGFVNSDRLAAREDIATFFSDNGKPVTVENREIDINEIANLPGMDANSGANTVDDGQRTKTTAD